MTWVKICGTTNLKDALTSAEAGADALGFVFWERSPRNIDLNTAKHITAALPGSIEKVGVFVNENVEMICHHAGEAGLTAVQLHGFAEDPSLADAIFERLPDLKVFACVSMRTECNGRVWNGKPVYAFLADSGDARNPGGTGQTFDWISSRERIRGISAAGRVVIAGGLTTENVSDAIRKLQPWGVDVVSGVEVSPGRKDPEKVRLFISAVREMRPA